MTPQQFAFRYRRQAAPFCVAWALLFAGAMAYEARNGLRVMLAVSALSVLAVVLVAPRMLDRTVERRYALVVVVACSVWVCVAASRGISSGLLLALLVGTLVLGVPWWLHVRVRRGDRRPATSTASWSGRGRPARRSARSPRTSPPATGSPRCVTRSVCDGR